MRRSLAGVALALVFAVAPSQAGDGQDQHGQVLVPLGAWHESCTDPYLAAVLKTTVRLEASFDFTFPVQSSTWGRRFVLTPDHPAADIDIRFIARGPERNFRTRTLGGESGRVPRGATQAKVCLALGTPTTFTYRAGSGA